MQSHLFQTELVTFVKGFNSDVTFHVYMSVPLASVLYLPRLGSSQHNHIIIQLTSVSMTALTVTRCKRLVQAQKIAILLGLLDLRLEIPREGLGTAYQHSS